MRFNVRKFNERMFLVPKEVDIEKYPFAYRKERPKGELDVSELIFPIPVKPHKKTKEEWWGKFWRTRRRQLAEEPGWSEVQAKPSIGKEQFRWDWTPGFEGHRSMVVGGYVVMLDKRPRLSLKDLKVNKKMYARFDYAFANVYRWYNEIADWEKDYILPAVYFYAGEDNDFLYVRSAPTGFYYALPRDLKEVQEFERKLKQLET